MAPLSLTRLPAMVVVLGVAMRLDGRTWVANAQRIEARRIGPPRTLVSLAPARK